MSKKVPTGNTKRKKRVTISNKPALVDVIVEAKAKGVSDRGIAKQIDTTGATVNRISHRPEIRKRINQLATELITEGQESIKQTILDTIQTSNEQGVAQGDKDTNTYRLNLRKLSLQASRTITDIAGLTTQQPSTVVQTLIQVEGNAILSDTLKSILHSHSQAITDTED